MLSQLALIARQLLQLTFDGFGVHRIAIAEQITLTLQQLVLAAGQILDVVQCARVLLITLDWSRSILIARLLLATQLSVEQRGKVGVRTVATGPSTGLLALDLSLGDLGLRSEELIERLHFSRKSFASPEPVERRRRLTHGRGRRRHGILLRKLRTWQRPLGAASSLRCPPPRVSHGGAPEDACHLLHTGSQRGPRRGDRLYVLLRLPSGQLRPTIELPCGDDDLLL